MSSDVSNFDTPNCITIVIKILYRGSAWFFDAFGGYIIFCLINN